MTPDPNREEEKVRRKLYGLSIGGIGDLFRFMAKAEGRITCENWPEDGRVIAAHVDPVRQRVLLTVTSEDFPEVVENGLLAIVDPVFTVTAEEIK